MAIERPIPLEQKIANRVSEKLPLAELASQISTMNTLLYQLLEQNQSLMDGMSNWHLDSRKHRDTMVEKLNQISINFTHALHGIGLCPDNPELCIAQVVAVPTAGNAVQLNDISIPKGHKVTIKALSANTGIVWIADSKVEAEAHTLAYPLTANQEHEYYIRNLSLLWVDAAVGNEGIAWVVEQNI